MLNKRISKILLVVCALLSSFHISIHAQQEKNDQEGNSTFVTGLIKFSAHITIPIAEIIASDAAAHELKAFRTGAHDGLPVVYKPSDEATVELLQGTYYQELTNYLIEAMSQWYGGKIPHDNGLYTHSDTFRVFSGTDAVSEIIDGIDMADIVGSFTYYVRMTTDSGFIKFHAVNVMSLSSYGAERYFQHNLVADPADGAFKSRVQIFEWRVGIPNLDETD